MNNIKKSYPIRVVALTNTRQTERTTKFVPGEAPDPRREFETLWKFGIIFEISDLNKFPLNPMARRGTFYAGFDLVRALKILLFARNADVILCIFENTALFLVLLRRVFLFRAKIALLEVSPRGWRLRNWVLDYVVPRVDKIIALTRHSKRYVEGSYKVKADVEFLSPGIDELFFLPMQREQKFTILSVGEDYSRDFATLLEACRPLSCRIVLKTKRKLNIPEEMENRVTIISERISHRALRDLYASAHIVCIPLIETDNPGGITSVLEAMSMGKAIVASYHGTTIDHITNGQEGLLVPVGDVVATREAITRIMENPSLSDRLGKNARARVEKEFARPIRACQLARILRRLVGAQDWPTEAVIPTQYPDANKLQSYESR